MESAEIEASTKVVAIAILINLATENKRRIILCEIMKIQHHRINFWRCLYQ